MGHYTRLNIKLKLRVDTPKNVLDFFDTLEKEEQFNHRFFNCSRWRSLFTGKNCEEHLKGLIVDKSKRNTHIEIESEFKDYDNEIENFLDWVKPYVASRKKRQFVGEARFDNLNAINLYLERL